MNLHIHTTGYRWALALSALLIFTSLTFAAKKPTAVPCGDPTRAILIQGELSGDYLDGVDTSVQHPFRRSYEFLTDGELWRLTVRDALQPTNHLFSHWELGTDGNDNIGVDVYNTNYYGPQTIIYPQKGGIELTQVVEGKYRSSTAANADVRDGIQPLSSVYQSFGSVLWFAYASGCSLRQEKSGDFPVVFYGHVSTLRTNPRMSAAWSLSETFPFAPVRFASWNDGYRYLVNNDGEAVKQPLLFAFTNFIYATTSFRKVGEWEIPETFTVTIFAARLDRSKGEMSAHLACQMGGKASDIRFVERPKNFLPQVRNQTGVADLRRGFHVMRKGELTDIHAVKYYVSNDWLSAEQFQTFLQNEQSGVVLQNPPKSGLKTYPVIPMFVAITLFFGVLAAWRPLQQKLRETKQTGKHKK